MRPLVRTRALPRWKGLVLSLLSVTSLALGEGRRARPARALVAPSAETRRARVLDAFSRVGAVRRCWQRQLLRDPTTRSRVLQVALHVDDVGAVREARVHDPSAPDLARCISSSALSLGSVGAGAPFVAETTVVLERGE